MLGDSGLRESVRRPRRTLLAAPRPLSRPAVAALGLLGAVLLLDFLADTPVVTPVELLRCVLFGLACLALPVSSRYPAVALLLFLPGSVAAASATGRIGIVTVMACVLAAVVATVSGVRGAVGALALLTVWAVGVSLVVYGDLTHLGPYLLFAVPATVVGLAFGRARLHLDRTERRNRDLLRYQDEIRAKERASLARDLHDVVAHQLTVIALIGGSRARSSDTERLREGLAEIGLLSGEALSELRTLLGVLRGSESSVADPDRARRSQVDVGLRQGVEQLAERLLDLGFAVDLTVEAPDEIRAPRTTVESALRILREATTNIIKYAAPASAVVVHVRLTTASLSLTVESEMGPQPARRRVDPELTSGQGLIGMRERAALLGGEATIGAVGRTWSVQVVLPL